MKILVGETELLVKNCYAYRYSNGKLVLKIEVPQTEITHDVLKALLKNNTEDIVKTDDEGKVETYSGFSYTVIITDREQTYKEESIEIYDCEVECISETERKVGDLKNTVNFQEATIAELREIIGEQSALIEAQAEMVDTIIAEILPMLEEDEGEIE